MSLCFSVFRVGMGRLRCRHKKGLLASTSSQVVAGHPDLRRAQHARARGYSIWKAAKQARK
jgi:hypothetical protein